MNMAIAARSHRSRLSLREPAGYLTGLNEYEYVSSNPPNMVDPSGLYGIDFHYYTVYYLMRAKGFSAALATNVAGWSQYTDEDSNTEPMWNSEDLRAKYHFPGSSPTKATVRDDPGAHAQLVTAIDGYGGKGGFGNAARLGVALHVFADSWGHEGFTAWHSDAINTRTGSWRPNTGHADAAQGCHAPDYPYNDVDKAVEAAKAIYDLLPDKGKVLPWADAAADLTKAFQVDTERYKRGFMEDVTYRPFFTPWKTCTKKEWKPPTEDEMIAAIKAVIKDRFGDTVSYDKDKTAELAKANDYYKRALGL